MIKPCRKSLTTAGSSPRRSNMNCKLQTRPLDRGYVASSGLALAVNDEKPDVKSL